MYYGVKRYPNLDVFYMCYSSIYYYYFFSPYFSDNDPCNHFNIFFNMDTNEPRNVTYLQFSCTTIIRILFFWLRSYAIAVSLLQCTTIYLSLYVFFWTFLAISSSVIMILHWRSRKNENVLSLFSIFSYPFSVQNKEKEDKRRKKGSYLVLA